MKIYLAGPIHGYPDFNFPAFHACAAKIRALGHEVFSPAEKGAEKEIADDPSLQNSLSFRRKVFALDTDYICKEADAIAMMLSWQESTGATAERALARAIGLIVFETIDQVPMVIPKYEDMNQTPEQLALKASLHEHSGGVYIGLSRTSQERKEYPIASGVFDYFPDALAEVAHVSFISNQKHNPGEPLHWARGKSDDHADCLLRHFKDRGKMDGPVRHSAEMVWRALAILQLEIEAAKEV